MAHDYVHGYSEREQIRLFDQASTLTELLNGDTRYPAGSLVLEAGCGVGAQTVILARNSPQARFVSIDVSAESLAHAEARVRRAGIDTVVFHEADIFDLPFPRQSFDHVFACFVLEHLADPGRALSRLRSCLKPGGTLTVIEGDHGYTDRGAVGCPSTGPDCRLRRATSPAFPGTIPRSGQANRHGHHSIGLRGHGRWKADGRRTIDRLSRTCHERYVVANSLFVPRDDVKFLVVGTVVRRAR